MAHVTTDPLTISLLGSLQVTRAGQQIDSFETAKVRALLAYLAVEGSRPLERSHLAGLLWPDMLESSARVNLRSALANLRKVIGDRQAESPFLLATRQTIQQNPNAIHTVDVAHFQNLCQKIGQQTPIDLPLARQAMACYRGPFLGDGLAIDSPAFEDWAMLQREALHRQIAELLIHVIGQLMADKDYDQAEIFAQRWVAHEPWREEAHAQLITALWHNGRGDAAMRQYEQCCKSLRELLGLEPSPETVALYEAIRDHRTAFIIPQPTLPPAPKPINALQTTTNIPHNIPPLLNPFFGRQRELIEMERLLNRPLCRQLTIIGPGGMGKTHLALAYARRVMDTFTDGVWFISLVGVAHGEQIPTVIAEFLDIPMVAEQEPLTRVTAYLREKSLLLILDNFEQLTSHATLINQLLAEAPHITILATSRERLNLQIETILPLHGLDFPHHADGHVNQVDDAAIQASSAIQFFVDCAKRANSTFTLNSENQTAILGICRLTDGMPLGLELAAAWTRVLFCTEIYDNLQQSMALLQTSMPDLPARHRSIQALIEESWQQLSATTQQVFAKLTLFQGGCDWPALQAVTEAELPQVAELIDRSLLHKTADGYFQTHELLRQFGAEKLAESPQTQSAVAQRHAHYYLHHLQKLEAKLRSSEQVAAGQDITHAIENIHAAWAWATAQNKVNMLQMGCAALFTYFDIRGLAYDGVALFEPTVKQLARQATPPAAFLVQLRNYIGAFLLPLGRTPECKRLLVQNVVDAEQNNLTNAVGWSQFWLGELYIATNTDLAQTKLTESLNLFRLTADAEGVIRALVTLSHLASRQLNLQLALDWATEALPLARAFDAPLLVAATVEQLGLVHLNLGNMQQDQAEFDQARRCFEEALSLARPLHNRMLEAGYVGDLGLLTTCEGNYEQGRTLMRESVQLFQQAGFNTGHVLVAEENLARLEYILGDYEAAIHLFEAVSLKSRQANNDLYRTRSEQGLALSLLKQGNVPKARQVLLGVLDLNYVADAPRLMAEFLMITVELLLAIKEYEAAAKIMTHRLQNFQISKNHLFDEAILKEIVVDQVGTNRYQKIEAAATKIQLDDLRQLIIASK